MISFDWSGVHEVVVVGAHCDDIAIGAGATLLGLASQVPGLRVQALVMTGAGTVREDEERRALAAFLPGADLDVTILDLPDGRLPEHWGAVKSRLGDLARRSRPGLVLAPQRQDAHQDHRLLAELVPTAFRDHLILGYEIVKWESDLPRTQLYQPLSPAVADQKADLLLEFYPSQVSRDWFDRQTVLGLLRIRGAQCHQRYAEAFMAEKMTLTPF